LMGGMMGYYLGRSLSSPIQRNVYRTPQAYQQTQTKTKPALQKTAQTKTVRKPVNARKGYGKKATRSTSRSYSG